MTRTGMRIIGLTGGIATGKSTVAAFMAEAGLVVIDADQLSREAVQPGSCALERIVAHFGSQVLQADGGLDRRKVAEMIFADQEKRRELEAILHPEIRRLAEERIALARCHGAAVVIYMAPLIIEAGATDRVDEIWVVTVRPEIQVELLMKRNGIGSDEATRIIASQMPLHEKERYGRIVIDNSGPIEETRRHVRELCRRELETCA